VTAKEAWYLHCTSEQVGSHAILVGDRGRVRLAAGLLDDAEIANEDRGLTTATGWFRGERVVVAAFGMGAPIATVVMHELAELGVTRFLRLGTAMTVGGTPLGSYVLAIAAVRGESTSRAYLPLEYPAVADPDLTAAVLASATAAGVQVNRGLYATFDGFYTHMLDIDPTATRVREGLARYAASGVIAADMETSALFVAAIALGVRAASFCLASVDGPRRSSMPRDERRGAEATLLRVGLDALVPAADRPAERRAQP